MMDMDKVWCGDLEVFSIALLLMPMENNLIEK